MIEIRKINKEEGSLLKRIRVNALSDAPGAFGSTVEAAMRCSIQEYNKIALHHSVSEKSTTFLAFNDNVPIGLAGAYFEELTERSFICSLWVSPKYRRNGIGMKIVTTVSDWLSERGANSVFAWVANSNLKAIAFYKQTGFISTGEIMLHPLKKNELETLFKRCVAGG